MRKFTLQRIQDIISQMKNSKILDCKEFLGSCNEVLRPLINMWRQIIQSLYSEYLAYMYSSKRVVHYRFTVICHK